MSKVLSVTVSPQGEITLQTQGFIGPECVEASRFLAQALGITLAEKRTAEFYADTSLPQQLTE